MVKNLKYQNAHSQHSLYVQYISTAWILVLKSLKGLTLIFKILNRN